jgi:hypothetical protein
MPDQNTKIRNIGSEKLFEAMKNIYMKIQSEQFIIDIKDLAYNLEKEVFKKNEKALKDRDKAESAYKTDIS